MDEPLRIAPDLAPTGAEAAQEDARPATIDFEDLVHAEQAGLYGALCLIIRDRGEAEDVMQEAFLKGTEPSTPADGDLVVDFFAIHPWRFVQVYADGRMIWLYETDEQQGTTFLEARVTTTGWLERRLTPEGVDFVRTFEVDHDATAFDPGEMVYESDVPVSMWEDPKAKPYVPSRYLACAAWSEGLMRLLPQQTQDLIRGYTDERAVFLGENGYSEGMPGSACPIVTIEEARALDTIFLEVGLERIESEKKFGALAYGEFDHLVHLIPLLPDGTFRQCCPG